MKVIRGLDNLKEKSKDVVLTIGNFDGVHLGHQKIFKKVLSEGGTSMAITFEPHPLKVIAPERGIRILTRTEEKIRLIRHYGIDIVLLVKFDREFANLHADDFIKGVIVGKINARKVIVGHNYAFGRGKKGTTKLLRRRGKKFGFGVSVVRNATLYGDVVSSSRIRSLLLRGRVCEASLFLGRSYMIEGSVIKGAGRGAALLGIPTANIETPNELVPKEGVYAVKVRFDGIERGGVANIGHSPTFKNSEVSYEAHIFDFSGDLLGRQLRVYFIDRLRDERAFPDIKALGAEIRKDIEKARETLRTKRHLELV